MRYFSIVELCHSDYAIANSIDNSPSEYVKQNLQALIGNILDPLRIAVNSPIIVSSGYRSPALNKALGGANTSQHLRGQAADIKSKIIKPALLCQIIIDLKLPFDQLINEFDQWVHVSYNAHRKRGEYLKASKSNGKTVYHSVKE